MGYVPRFSRRGAWAQLASDSAPLRSFSDGVDLADGDELADVGHGGAGIDQLNDLAELDARQRPRADDLLFT
jgi:hypothetical protein